MSLTEVLHAANKLSRVERIRLIQLLAERLVTDDSDLAKTDQPRAVWSPFNDRAAAAKMTKDDLLRYVAAIVDRQDVSPMDRAIAADLLMTNFGILNKEVAKAFNLTPPQIAQFLYLLKCVPEIQILVHRGEITMNEAKSCRLDSKQEQVLFAEERASQNRVSIPELVGAPRRRGHAKKR